MTRLNNKDFNKEYPMLASLENKELNKYPLRFHMEEIKEEIKAWDNGLLLARKLDIPINETEYFKYAARFILEYMARATVDRKWLLK